MILVTGGAYQGKLDYAKEEYGLTDNDVFTCEETSTAVGFDEKIIDHFERYVLALIKAGQVPERAVGMQIRAGRYKNRIIICDDISQGVVPMDKTERAWREGVGRTMVKVAQQADKVVRVFCGIPDVIKDEAAEDDPAPKTDGLEAVFAAEANGAVKKETDKPSETAKAPKAAQEAEKPEATGDVQKAEVKQADKTDGVGSRGQNTAPRTPFGTAGQNTASHTPFGSRGQNTAPRTPFGMPGANPFEHFDFGNADEGGLTPEEQFRMNFEKMKAERKAAKEKAAKEQAAKEAAEKDK